MATCNPARMVDKYNEQIDTCNPIKTSFASIYKVYSIIIPVMIGLLIIETTFIFIGMPSASIGSATTITGKFSSSVILNALKK